MFQKQSASGVHLKRCLSFLKNTSGGMLLEFLKNRVRRGLLFLLSSQKNSLFFIKIHKSSLLLHESLMFFLFAMSKMPCIGC